MCCISIYDTWQYAFVIDLSVSIQVAAESGGAHHASGAKVHPSNDALALASHIVAGDSVQSWAIVHLL